MEQKIKPCECGCIEFITQPNQYDIYQINNGKLELIETLNTEDEEKLFFRECSKELQY